MTGFVQTEPDEGEPATERTEVRILYDDKYIYIGVMCYDSDPSQVIVTDSRRDSSLADADSFQMILDTYHDLQNGFIFGTNAAGVQYDAQVRRGEGEPAAAEAAAAAGAAPRSVAAGARRPDRAAASTSTGTRSWDVKARITDDGLVGGVSHSAAHASLRPAAAVVGAQFLPQHPAQARGGSTGRPCRGSTRSTGCRRRASCAGLNLPDAAQLQVHARTRSARRTGTSDRD